MSIAETIRHLYAVNPYSVNSFARKRYTLSLDDCLALIVNYPPSSLSLDMLKKYVYKRDLTDLLAHLSAKDIFSNFGEDVLLWTWLKTDFLDKQIDLRLGLAELTGRDQELLEQARSSSWEVGKNSEYDVKTIMKTYELLSDLKNVTDRIDFYKILVSTAKEGIILSEKRLKKYSIETLRVKKNYKGYASGWKLNKTSRDNLFSIFLDTPVGICLKYDSEPNCVSSFIPVFDDTLMIYQIQGIRGLKNNYEKSSARGLAVIDFKKFLVDYVKEIAGFFSFNFLGLRSAHNNDWTWVRNKSDGSIRLPLEKAFRSYDETALRLGFEQRKDRNWYKKI